ncbi:MAG: amidohydrolase family protein [Ruminococcus sp.]|nr:amidohydrolase family protein [Ruminococcus sp.]
MIIDTHVHIGHMIGFNMREADVLYSMEKYNIDFSLVSNIECAEFNKNGKKIPRILQKSQNRVFRNTLDFARRYPDKIGVLVWVKLFSEKPDEEFENLIKNNRDIIYGLKFHPFHSLVAPDDERAEPYYEIAEKYNLAVVSHTGGCEEARSIHLYNAALKHPNINFVMVHMDLGTDNREALDLLAKLSNLYGDTSWVPLKTTLEAVKRYGSEKTLFGSDNPIDGKDTYQYNKWGERSLYQEYFNEFKKLVSQEDYDNIMCKNAEKIFGIKISGK